MKRIATALLLICLLSFSAVPCFAAELSEAATSGSSVVSTEVPYSHPISVKVDNASVSFNGSSGDSLNIPRLEEFKLQIKPNDGYMVKQILLNGEDVTENYKDGVLTLSGVYEASDLTVITDKAPVTPASETDKKTDENKSDSKNGTSNSNKTGDTNMKSPQTGEYTNFAFWTALMIASLSTVFIIGVKTKGRKTEE